MSDEGRAEPARARASWPVRRAGLTSDARDGELVADATASQRVAMVWALTLDAWAMRGEPLPDYPRTHAPGQILRPVRT